MQTTIDRRVYPQKYDAEQTLAAFAVKVREEVDWIRLRADLLAAVDETVEPAHVSLWLRRDFGRAENRLLLHQSAALSAGDRIIEALLTNLSAFAGPDWEQEDDVTLVDLEWPHLP